MTRYIIRRILESIPVVLALTFSVFALMRIIPGGPFDFAGDKKLPAAVTENLKRRFHLEWPLMWQFASYTLGDDVTGFICEKAPVIPGCDVVLPSYKLGISEGLIRFDLGMAMRQRGRTVNDIVAESLPVSFQLGMFAVALALVVGIPAGTMAALKQNTWVDYTSSFFAILGLSVPALVLGPLLIWIFALKLDWFPVSTWGAKPPFFLGLLPSSISIEYFSYAVLPAIALGSGFSANIARLTRASLLQVIREDYIRTARAKGLRERVVVVRHALKNSLIPVVTILGPLFAAVVTGTFVVEQIFGIPGMGRHFVQSITNRDYPLITGVTFIFMLVLVGANLVVDLTYAWLDPRIRYD